MLERLTARVLLCDPAGRILLMKGRLPSRPEGPGAWFTVGGGVEAGESLREAAAREAREETGFDDVVIGPLLWTGENLVSDAAGRPLLSRDHFFLARCGGGEPSRDGWQALERAFVDDIRWWTLADLAATAEPVFPRDLAARLGGWLESGALESDAFSGGSCEGP